MQRMYYLSVSSLTIAMKALGILTRYEIPARVERVGSRITGRGCGYAVVVQDNLLKAKEILNRHRIVIRSVTER